MKKNCFLFYFVYLYLFRQIFVMINPYKNIKDSIEIESERYERKNWQSIVIFYSN